MWPNLSQKQFLWKQIDFQPYPLQSPPLEDCTSRVVLATGGERAGKSRVTSAEGTAWLPFSSLIWIVGPDYEQCRSEFTYIMEDALKMGLTDPKEISMPQEGRCRLTTFTGCVVETKSADDVMKLANKAPDLILMVEAAQQSMEVVYKLRGRTAEKRGRLWISGTIESGQAWFDDLYLMLQGENIFQGRSYSIPSWANLGIYPGGRTDPEILALERTLGDDLFHERHAAIPRKSSLLVLPEFDHTCHVQSWVKFDPELPVALGVDPGYAGAYAVVAAHIFNQKILVFDEVYVQRPETGTKWVIDECRARPWWKNVEDIVMDVAGKAKNLSDGKSVMAIWYEQTKLDRLNHGRGIYPRGQTVGIQDGIDRYRHFLGNRRYPDTARILFNPICTATIREHNLYRYRTRRNSPNAADNEKPVDRNNHGIKATTYLLIDKFGYYDGPPPVTRVEMALQHSPDWLEDYEPAHLPFEFRDN